MYISNFSDFRYDESFMGIDLSDLKSKAKKFVESKDFKMLLSSIDIDILNKFKSELEIKIKKYGSLESYLKRSMKKAESVNEGILSTIVLSIFGMHSLLTLLRCIRDNDRFIPSLFVPRDEYQDSFKGVRNIIIFIIFAILMIGYFIFSVLKANMTETRFSNVHSGEVGNIRFHWDGFHDYTYIDSFDKEYHVKRVDNGEFNIYYNDVLIGKEDGDGIKNIKGDLIMSDVQSGKASTIPIDLEKMLTKKVNMEKKKSIEKSKIEITNLKNKIDSLNNSLFENLDQARKIVNDSIRILGPDFKSSRTYLEFEDLKRELESDNKLGYLGFFTKMLIHHKYSYSSILEVYERLKVNSNILNKLRDKNGNLKSVIEFDNLFELDNCITELEKWKMINKFMSKIPPTQKSILWENGWFSKEVISIRKFIEDAILTIDGDETKKKIFFSKISSIKDKKSMMNYLSNILKKSPWDIDHYESKINSTRNAAITWKGDNMLVCMVLTFRALNKIVSNTNWCIARERSQFNKYESKGGQYIIYDFNKNEDDGQSLVGFTINTDNMVTDCHNRFDGRGYIPHFMLVPNHYGNYRRALHTVPRIKSEYTQLPKNSLLKFDRTFWKLLNLNLREPLKKKPLTQIIDWWN